MEEIINLKAIANFSQVKINKKNEKILLLSDKIEACSIFFIL